MENKEFDVEIAVLKELHERYPDLLDNFFKVGGFLRVYEYTTTYRKRDSWIGNVCNLEDVRNLLEKKHISLKPSDRDVAKEVEFMQNYVKSNSEIIEAKIVIIPYSLKDKLKSIREEYADNVWEEFFNDFDIMILKESDKKGIKIYSLNGFDSYLDNEDCEDCDGILEVDLEADLEIDEESELDRLRELLSNVQFKIYCDGGCG